MGFATCVGVFVGAWDGGVAMSHAYALLEAVEAKAMYGLAIDWQPLQALTEALLDRGVLQVGGVGTLLLSFGVVLAASRWTFQTG